MIIIKKSFLLQAALLAFSGLYLPLTQATTILQGNAIVHYDHASSDQLTLDVRPIELMPIDSVNAQMNGIDLPVTPVTDKANSQKQTAILFLVDTSDPKRQRAVDNAIRHIDRLLEYKQPHYRYALARFDTDLHFLTQFGVSPETIRERAQSLKAEGKTTELYRNTLVALKQLSRYPADRKALILLSDGRAEDKAYFHRDVAQSAIKNNISIHTIGYPDTIGLSVSLQTLRRLSEETGGQYLPTQAGNYQLDDTRLQEMFGSIDQGAQYKIDLSPALQANTGGRQEIVLSVTSGASFTLIKLPVQLPAVAVTAAAPPVAAAAPAVPQTIIVQSAPETSADANLLQKDDWMMIIASLALVAVIIFLIIQLRRRPIVYKGTATEEESESTEDAFAWLQIEDDHSANPRRYPIRSAATKIGRYRGNDVALHDSAISRYHAEILFTDDGRFIIADMGSKNGIMVNDKETLEHELKNNDIIEIGDIRLRFIMPEVLADDLQDTQIFKTQIPPLRNHA